MSIAAILSKRHILRLNEGEVCVPEIAGGIDDPVEYDRIFRASGVSKEAPLEYLQELLRTPAIVAMRTRPGYIGWVPDLPSFGDRVLRVVFKHLRKNICAKRKISLKGSTATGLCAIVAASVAPEVGLPEAMVIGIVAAVMQFLLTLARDVFCEMTDDRVIEAIGDTKPATKRERATSAKKKAASKKKQ